MGTLIVPPVEGDEWPTLGPQVARWMERSLIFGPGDLRGEPYRLDVEKRALLYRMYQVFPQGHPQAGRRRFSRVCISLRKGTAKTEFAAAVAAVELAPDGPVRCVGWDASGQPVGGPVRDPYIPMLAYTEEQSEELAYYALYVMLTEGPRAGEYDVGLERIMRRGGDGRAAPLATAPDARDGARTTFQVFDETHRLVLPRQRQAHQTMLANIPKRKLADAWSLEITTAPAPGEGSVAERTMDYARRVSGGAARDSRLFYFHRQAGDQHDLSTEEGARAAVVEASGPLSGWTNIDAILDLWRDPTTDRTYWERVWLNRLVRSADRAFDVERWKQVADPDRVVPDGALITLGFDGARTRDATALVATEVATGYQWLVGLWERPVEAAEWEVPKPEVSEALAAAFQRWNVWRMYADPPYWETTIAEWAGEYGDERVIEWFTTRTRPMAFALRGFSNAMRAGELSHSGDPDLQRHIGNAVRRYVNLRDDEDKPLWLIQKERPDSPHKMDAAMAAVLSWEARTDAVSSGATVASELSHYNEEGLFVI